MFYKGLFKFYVSSLAVISQQSLYMPSGVPKGENCQVDMDSKAGDLFSAEDAHPTGTGGAGVLARYVLKCFAFFSAIGLPIFHTVELTCASVSLKSAANVCWLTEPLM